MITTSDIATILYKDCKAFGITNIYKDGTVPVGEITAERITIHAKKGSPETIWKKSFVEVNLIVPDIDGLANTKRLGELERQAYTLLDDKYGVFDDSKYIYSIYQSETIEDVNKSHYVNVRVLFQVLNVKL
jgi:hypothetical protein